MGPGSRSVRPGRHQKGKSLSYWIYILASKPRGTLYVGVTNDLVRRVAEHRDGVVPGFTKTYNVKMLVYLWNTRACWKQSVARSG